MTDQPKKDAQDPAVQVGDFCLLRVVDVNPIGAFLDWGLEKNLLLPYAEQTRALRPGDDVLVGIYLDTTSRPCATMKTDSLTTPLKLDAKGNCEFLKNGDPVEILISGKTPLGYKAIINNKFLGLLYENEVFHPLKLGARLPAFVKKLRPDGKIDLILSGEGLVGRDQLAEKIILYLEKHQGFMEINDKTSAELIYQVFAVSRKKFKVALGGLYKQRRIRIQEDGTYLVARD